MMFLLAAELGFLPLAAAAFVAAYALTSRWNATPIGRHIMAFSVVTGVEGLLLFLLAVGVMVPLWLFALVFAALDAVVVQRIYLLLRAHRRR